MVPRLNPAGTSFKGLALYLTHDPNADTTGRVAWTHTLNCAFDHVPSAVDEMLTTWRDADLLKQEAGVRRGGRALEAPVKHVSLNWHPSERPSRDDMIGATEAFLAHRHIVLVYLLLMSGGCVQLGPAVLRNERLSYNEAVHYTSAEQLLLNIVRAHHQEIATFSNFAEVDSQASAGFALSGGSANIGALSPLGALSSTLSASETSIQKHVTLSGYELIQ